MIPPNVLSLNIRGNQLLELVEQGHTALSKQIERHEQKCKTVQKEIEANQGYPKDGHRNPQRELFELSVRTEVLERQQFAFGWLAEVIGSAHSYSIGLGDIDDLIHGKLGYAEVRQVQ